ncbi:YeaC family protein [Amnimonas aquatica]|uniref:DUF1315 domain-containing protein n=1 Tax=Amnimonas aquatica TaxID=2094561 RepID=A0A2P6AU23_9GAMM|nr:DUF1315 family protein [Amnimonas aquatica]PQA49355.1 DUF1315 domain-containing protein [Amnimonas aquatica]
MNEAVLARMLQVLTPDIVASLRRAVELGKWPDGRRLTREQVETCLQAVIAWETKHLPEQERSGYIEKEEKEGEVCDDPAVVAEQQVKFLH